MSTGGKYVVRVCPDIEEESYRSLDGQPVRLPAKRGDQPRAELLRRHNDECRWLNTGRPPTLDTRYQNQEAVMEG